MYNLTKRAYKSLSLGRLEIRQEMMRRLILHETGFPP